MCSAPGVDDELQVTVKRVPDGLVSNWMNDTLAAGHEIEATCPAGVSRLSPGAGDLVLFAGGSGITPVISLVKAALTTTNRKVHLVYANRDRASTIFADQLDNLAAAHPERFELVHHLDAEQGFVDDATIAPFAGVGDDPDFYVCGPSAFMDIVERSLLDQGMAPDRIHIERFSVPEPTEEAEAPADGTPPTPSSSAGAPRAATTTPARPCCRPLASSASPRRPPVRQGVARRAWRRWWTEGHHAGEQRADRRRGRRGLGAHLPVRARQPDGARRLRMRMAMDEGDIADITELQQTLARYAVGMTKNDVDSVVDVFTPDGTYSAFGDTYTLADFPTLVAAAPKGLFMVGPPAVDLDLETGTGTGEQPLCFVEQTKHDMRIGWYTDTYRTTDAGWRIATRSMTFLRRSGAGTAAGPTIPRGPTPTAAGRGGRVELDEFRAGLDAWLDDHPDELAPTYDPPGTLDERHRPDVAGEGARSSTPAGCAGAGPSGSAASAARRCCARYLGAALAARDLVRARPLLDDRGARAPR